MVTTQEKVSLLSELMTKGVLSAGEFDRAVAALEPSPAADEPAWEQGRHLYEAYLSTVVTKAFRSSAAVTFPPLEPTMVKRGWILLDGKKRYIPYIETYIDGADGLGAAFREDILIGIDEQLAPVFWAQPHRSNRLLHIESGWTTMSLRRVKP